MNDLEWCRAHNARIIPFAGGLWLEVEGYPRVHRTTLSEAVAELQSLIKDFADLGY